MRKKLPVGNAMTPLSMAFYHIDYLGNHTMNCTKSTWTQLFHRHLLVIGSLHPPACNIIRQMLFVQVYCFIIPCDWLGSFVMPGFRFITLPQSGLINHGYIRTANCIRHPKCLVYIWTGGCLQGINRVYYYKPLHRSHHIFATAAYV